jgi:extracellular elastinolytic metalloproteinase
LGINGDFVIREDSYQDKNTGVSHVYLRQVVNGLEVIDGDINLNILDGKVISFGDSFYRGVTPSSPFKSGSVTSDAKGCPPIFDPIRLPNGQTILSSPTCHLTSTSSTPLPKGISSPATAALNFILASHPSSDLTSDILSNYDAYLKRITSSTSASTGKVELTNVPGTVSLPTATLSYIQVPSNNNEKATATLTLVWKLHVELHDNYYETTIDALNPTRIISAVDFVADAPACAPPAQASPPTRTHASPLIPIPPPQPDPTLPIYKVFPFTVNDPSVGSRKLIQPIPDGIASSLGWHSLPANRNPVNPSSSPEIFNSTTTFGNNVFAQENWSGADQWLHNYRPQSQSSPSNPIPLVFNFPYPPEIDPDGDYPPKSYVDFAITQVFYTVNMIHDLYYRYGFDEASGNFQQANFGRGGRDSDAVIAQIQDGSGFNNANFLTPPDGQNGRMRMYVWNTASPFRDGDLDAGVVIHELTHGLSTRLTGGPGNGGCLGWGESGGMGEGWSDFLATTIRSTKDYSDYPMGAWVANKPKGIRFYPYSTDKKTNPSTYTTLNGPNYSGVHAIGEVWAEILYVVSQKLIQKYGFAESLFPPTSVPRDGSSEDEGYWRRNANGKLVPRHGNSLIVQLVINGMKLQPCRPSFFQARDAIIQADENLTGGENKCDLWKGFSERGLGSDATLRGSTPWGGGTRTNGFAIPNGICTN